jgi:hypothetical protein
MAQVFYDRVKETATVTGASNPYALAGAETSYQAFGTVLANGATCFYCAVGRTSNSWETGLGTYTTSGDTLARTAVQESSNSNSAVNWGSETIDIFLTQTSTVANNIPTNNTSASSDYSMAVGETAYVTYSGATSVPLHIATTQGVYELKVFGDTTVSPNTGSAELKPNNTTYTAGSIKFSILYYTFNQSAGNTGNPSSSAYYDDSTQTAFNIGNGLVISSESTISTFTNNKKIHCESYYRTSSTSTEKDVSDFYWSDTTTAWTSLGTIAFPFSQNGTIIVKRVF